jgi:glycosyltransferase involved in cell wall biosynthesis
MARPVDVAVVAADPWFGGGGRRMTEAFVQAVLGLGRRPHLLYLARGGTAATSADATPYAAVLPQLDSASQLLGGLRMTDAVRRSASVWVVAPAAHFGYAAARSGRRYALWLATSLADEWAARGPGLPATRRAALRANGPVLRRLERAVLRRASAVYAISPATRDALVEAGGVAPGSVGILPLPVDAGRFVPEADEPWLRRAREAPLLTFVGRAADPRKNVGLLIDAFGALRQAFPAARVRMVGGRPEQSVRLPDGAEVVGEVPDVAPWLRESTLFVLPSLQEGFGFVVAEALAAGVPAVVTPSGGPEELVRASGAGRVLDGFDPGGLAAAAGELLALGDDELLAMRHAGRAHVAREHSPDRLLEALASAFEDLDG